MRPFPEFFLLAWIPGEMILLIRENPCSSVAKAALGLSASLRPGRAPHVNPVAANGVRGKRCDTRATALEEQIDRIDEISMIGECTRLACWLRRPRLNGLPVSSLSIAWSLHR